MSVISLSLVLSIFCFIIDHHLNIYHYCNHHRRNHHYNLFNIMISIFDIYIKYYDFLNLSSFLSSSIITSFIRFINLKNKFIKGTLN